MRVYIFDLDGTQADLSHRLHHIQQGRYDHDAFMAGIPDDLPIWPVIELARACDAHAGVICTTGRPENTRASTESWLQRYDSPFRALYMRADGDTRPDHVVKRQMLEAIRADGYEIIAVIDDRQSVVDMWREEGLTCLQCAAPDSRTPKGVVPHALTLMVGPSGAGKSSWLATDHARNDYGIHPQHVIASDQVRLDLFGTLRCADKNDDVFEALHSVVAARLRVGLPVTVDATNIRNKDRITIASLAKGGPVHYVVVDRPLKAKLRDGGWRLEVKFPDGANLIERHDNVFRSNIREIMNGDGLPNVVVYDERQPDPSRMAAA